MHLAGRFSSVMANPLLDEMIYRVRLNDARCRERITPEALTRVDCTMVLLDTFVLGARVITKSTAETQPFADTFVLRMVGRINAVLRRSDRVDD